MHAHSLPLALTALALTCVPAAAQSKAAEQHTAGFGTVKRYFNASTLLQTFDYVITGVAFMNGEAYIGTRNATPRVLVTRNGKLVRNFGTPFSPTTGTYDMDTDGKGVIFAISGTGIIAYDRLGKTGTAAARLQVQTKNGMKPLTKNPIPIPFTVSNPVGAGVAFNPDGDNGNGSFYVVNHSSTADPIIELSLDGSKTLNSYPNQGWLGSGLTRDPRTGNLWCMHAPSGGSTGGGMDVLELDINNQLKPTGNRFMQGFPSVQWPLRCCGGLCGIPGGDPHSYKSDFDIMLLNAQPGDDYVFVHRIHLNPGVLGYNEGMLEGSINSTTLSRGGFNGDLGSIKSGDMLRFRTNANKSGQGGKPAIIAINVGPDARRVGSQPLISPELRILAPYTTPSSPIVIELFTTLGGPTVAVPIPSGVLSCFDRVRMQAVYFQPKAPPPFHVVATNELFATSTVTSPCNIVVETVGPNSFNNVTTSGFFRVIHKGGAPITKVVFDWFACTDLRQTEIYFDTDNPTMADQFNFGNSTKAGFTGTYRNGSDVACGLIYDKLNTPVGPNAAAGANTGWIGTNEFNNGTAGYNYKTITFRFAIPKFQGSASKPKVFEFDVDTDRGRGVSGDLMAGMVIRVTTLGGREYVGVLQTDTKIQNRSFVGFK